MEMVENETISDYCCLIPILYYNFTFEIFLLLNFTIVQQSSQTIWDQRNFLPVAQQGMLQISRPWWEAFSLFLKHWQPLKERGRRRNGPTLSKWRQRSWDKDWMRGTIEGIYLELTKLRFIILTHNCSAQRRMPTSLSVILAA